MRRGKREEDKRDGKRAAHANMEVGGVAYCDGMLDSCS